MDRTRWILLLVGVGVVAAIVIGLLGNRSESQAQAQSDFCASLSTLGSSIDDLVGMSPSSSSRADYQSALSAIDDDWDQVTSDASDLKDVTVSQLDDAWDAFESSVDDVDDDASVSDAVSTVASSAQTLASSVASTLSGPDCS